MTYAEIKNKVATDKDYMFLSTNEHLGNNVCLLGLGGSYAYGTNIETSDIDVRCIALNTAEEILCSAAHLTPGTEDEFIWRSIWRQGIQTGAGVPPG